MSKLLYLIDDQPEQLDLLTVYAKKSGFEVKTFTRAADCLNALGISISTNSGMPDAIITDLYMPEMDGISFIQACRKQVGEGLPILVLTVSDSTAEAVKAIREGAWDFMTKPLSYERFQVTVQNMFEKQHLKDEIAHVVREAQGKADFADIIGTSDKMQALFHVMRKAAPTDIPVLLNGESGVGKELVAKALHQASSRADGPLITVNCGAIPENLIESILFGHEKGAFTGATRKTEGKFKAADGGTLFLDELGELPINAQVKLLRALQEGEIEPVGAAQAVPVNVRIICATNKSLCRMLKEGTFREDLFYRVNVLPIYVPALRERPEDIHLLAQYFSRRVAIQNNQAPKTFSKGALTFLEHHPWPGNVRQLENAVYRAIIHADNQILEASDFSFLSPDVPFTNEASGEILPLAEIENRYIEYVLDLCKGNLTQAARKLGIGRATLYRKLPHIKKDG